MILLLVYFYIFIWTYTICWLVGWLVLIIMYQNIYLFGWHTLTTILSLPMLPRILKFNFCTIKKRIILLDEVNSTISSPTGGDCHWRDLVANNTEWTKRRKKRVLLGKLTVSTQTNKWFVYISCIFCQLLQIYRKL